MLRKSLITDDGSNCFHNECKCCAIEVPKGQPPVPGADASIPANAYENYRHINKVAEQEAESYSQFAKSRSKKSAIYA